MLCRDHDRQYPCYVMIMTGSSPYFIQILYRSSHLIKLYIPISSPNTEPKFTTAQREVKEAFRQGSGSMIVLVPNVGTPWTRDRLVTSQTNLTFIFCVAESTAPQIFFPSQIQHKSQ